MSPIIVKFVACAFAAFDRPSTIKTVRAEATVYRFMMTPLSKLGLPCQNVTKSAFGKKSVKAGDDPNGRPSFLRESPSPDVVSQSRSYFLAHVTGTVWLTRAS